MGGGVDVESEAGGVECEHGQPEDSDDVIGPPLPPGYNGYKVGVKMYDCQGQIIEIFNFLLLFVGVCHWSKYSFHAETGPQELVFTVAENEVMPVWDFAGMDLSFRSFRTIQPYEKCVAGEI